jgi:C1A family cysteine protease
MPALNLTELNAALRNVGARWEAAQPAEEHLLGYVPGPEDHSFEEREHLSRASYTRFMAMAAAAAAPPYPPAIDWRHFPAHAPLPAGDYVTPVRDQKTCGSCVAFGTLAAFESAIRIHDKNPAKAVDLSEADLFYCHGEAEHGRRCGGPSGGWWPDAALACCQNPGVVDEPCFPYTPGDQPCKKCTDWKKRLTKIAKWQKITSTTAMKQWLATRGPLITCFTVYADFYSYHSGIYHHVSGALEGGHCVCCVGYDDARRYWICKNSWNTTWGDHGFFNIAYGQVGIDAAMWALEI